MSQQGVTKLTDGGLVASCLEQATKNIVGKTKNACLGCI
jgi:hypothetical protein